MIKFSKAACIRFPLEIE